MRERRVVIVGAGPIGLHAALRAAIDGHDVTVLERGDIGSAVMQWSHVRLFTPFSMNSTECGRSAAGESAALPEPDELLTGAAYVDRYLRPLARCERLSGRIRTAIEVIAAGRSGCTKSRWIGQPQRSESSFRILVRNANGQEEIVDCDILLDCTGQTAERRFIGAGGIPCPGELTHLVATDYQIAATSVSSAQHTVVVGSGYSAATSVCALSESAEHITWITRGDRPLPIEPIINDSLSERTALTSRANELALSDSPRVTWLPGVFVEAINRIPSGLELTLSDGIGQLRTLRCDRIVANPGFRPNSRPFEELQIHRCYATEGPMKMAAHLLGETAGDCLSQSAAGADLLRNPEPDFFILGAASYGRDSRFLLKNGLEQVEQLFDSLLPVTEAAL